MAGKRIDAIDPSGQLVTIPEEQATDAQLQGFRLATPEALAERDQRARYGNKGGRAFLEGVGRVGTLGLSDVAQVEGAGIGTDIGNYLADLTGVGPTEQATSAGLGAGTEAIDRYGQGTDAMTEAKAGLLGVQQANSGWATAGELVGGLGLGIATGGLGTSGLAARGTTTLGRAGYTALAGGLEGTAYGAAKAADDDFLRDREITVERILLGAGEGAALGGALGGSMSLLGSGAKYAAGKAVSALGDSGIGGWLDRTAGESAYKAITGRTNKASIKLADRQGGAAAVGKTVYDAGIDLTADAETILAQTSAAADETGQKLGLLAGEADGFGGGGPSRIGLRDALEERVFKPLDKGTFSEDTAATVRSKLRRLMDQLSLAERPIKVRGPAGERELTRDSITFGELRDLRMEIDEELANWNNLTAEQGPLKAYRNTRRVMEEYWLDTAENAAKASGRDGFAAEVSELKTKYARLALARDEAQEAVITQLANRATSLSDTLTGVGTAGGIGGPVGMFAGVASSQAHKFVRERGRGYLATAIYRARQAATRGEEHIESAASGLLSSTIRGVGSAPSRVASSVPIAGVVLNPSNPASYEEAIQHLLRLQDPTSEERRRLNERNAELAAESPEHAAAIDAQTQRTADFLVAKAGESSTDLSRPFAHLRKPKHDRGKAAALGRYAAAAQNPQAALKRVASGEQTREDLETLRELYPRIWARFGSSVKAQLAELKTAPPYRSRLRLSRVLEQPMTAFETPAFQQAIAESRGVTEAEEKKAHAASTTQLAKSSANQSIGSDRAIARGE